MNIKIAICLTIILCIWITGLFLWVFVLRDTWEVDNSQEIKNMIGEIKSLYQANRQKEAVAKYDELFLFMGNRKLKNSEINKLISDVNATTYETRIILNTQKYMAIVEDIEKKANELISDGNFTDAIKKYVEALNLIENCGIKSTELDEIKKRMLGNIKFAEEKEQQRQLDELSEQQERLRQAEEKENAKKRIDDIVSKLPPLQDVLQEAISSNMGQWMLWNRSLQIQEIETKLRAPKRGTENSPDKYILPKEEVVKRIQVTDTSTSPLLIAYRDEILDIIEYVGWSWSSFGNPDEFNSNYIPIKFSVKQNQLAIILGTIFSSTVYNNVNTSVNTPKKRASSFIQKEVLPSLLNTKLPEKLKVARFGHLGILFIYGNGNFIKEDNVYLPEVLAIVVSTRDLTDFVKRDLSQEAFLNKSSVYIASETSQFIKVEITLE